MNYRSASRIRGCLAVILSITLVMLATEKSVQAETVISGSEAIQVTTLPDVGDLWVSPDDFTRINGFELKPEGACYQDICVPLRQDRDSDLFVNRDGKPWLNATGFADKLGQAYAVDRESKTWSFGMVPMSRKGFLESADAPDFELKDRNGDLVRLSDYRGKKVLIITWASW